jgi:hypothetical protein
LTFKYKQSNNLFNLSKNNENKNSLGTSRFTSKNKIDTLYENRFKITTFQKKTYYLAWDSIICLPMMDAEYLILKEYENFNYDTIKDVQNLIISGGNVFISGGISTLDCLQFLEFRCCDAFFSPKITAFKNLKKIIFDVDGKAMKYLPDFIYKTKSLTTLKVSIKNEKSITNEIRNLPNLEYISLTMQKFNKIPQVLYSLKNLKRLDILSYQWHKPINLSPEMHKLENLQEISINIDLNEDKNISILAEMKKLKTLNILKYTSIDIDELKKISFLNELNIWKISDNELENLKLILPNTKCRRGFINNY